MVFFSFFFFEVVYWDYLTSFFSLHRQRAAADVGLSGLVLRPYYKKEGNLLLHPKIITFLKTNPSTSFSHTVPTPLLHDQDVYLYYLLKTLSKLLLLSVHLVCHRFSPSKSSQWQHDSETPFWGHLWNAARANKSADDVTWSVKHVRCSCKGQGFPVHRQQSRHQLPGGDVWWRWCVGARSGSDWAGKGSRCQGTLRCLLLCKYSGNLELEWLVNKTKWYKQETGSPPTEKEKKIYIYIKPKQQSLMHIIMMINTFI